MMEKLERHRRGGEEENGKTRAEGERKQNPTARTRNSGEGGGRCQGLWGSLGGGAPMAMCYVTAHLFIIRRGLLNLINT
jgi:hypothetical protein